MTEYAYAVVHDGNKNILMFRKNQRGYFFRWKAIKRQGKELHGGGKWSIPGGKVDSRPRPNETDQQWKERVTPEAVREFEEETRTNISALPSTCQRWWDDALHAYYYGTYFECIPDQLKDSLDGFAPVLAAGKNAHDLIRNGKIHEGFDVRLIEGCGIAQRDDEQESVEIWNIDAKWNEIETWTADRDLSWFYQILLKMRQ
ncbi:NUDIX hydrolase [Streptomyces rimosus]|uniref:NUDIX hydrolase n=1 Tax=Streptomyces rimosus TaxID=1927 RepID=UPI00131AF429|nr:NUDIX hydrolase [Streptomyces rimosus]